MRVAVSVETGTAIHFIMEDGRMDTRVAVMSMIVGQEGDVESLNRLLHEEKATAASKLKYI